VQLTHQIDQWLAAASVEPLRESAQRMLVQAHLCEGNVVEACRAFDAFRVLLRHEMGLEPGFGVTELVRDRR
jgi:DNA-binding SARP family transcriptional activator